MSLFNQGEKAYLLLADGTILEGIHFGVKGTAIGEVVFTTGMTAYQETMTELLRSAGHPDISADRKLRRERSRQRI